MQVVVRVHTQSIHISLAHPLSCPGTQPSKLSSHMIANLQDTLYLCLFTSLLLLAWRVGVGLLFNRGHHSVEQGFAFVAGLSVLLIAVFFINRLLYPSTGICLTARGDSGCGILNMRLADAGSAFLGLAWIHFFGPRIATLGHYMFVRLRGSRTEGLINAKAETAISIVLLVVFLFLVGWWAVREITAPCC